MTTMPETVQAARIIAALEGARQTDAQQIAELEAARARDAQRIAELEDGMAALCNDLETVTSTRDALAVKIAKIAAAPPPAPAPAHDYADVHDFMIGWFGPRAERVPSSRLRWCPYWWKHPEATEIITVMHGEYQRALRDPNLGPGAFLRNSFYPWLERLTNPNGPFASCDPQRHEEPTSLPIARPRTARPSTTTTG